MDDRTAPVLLGISLPTSIDLGQDVAAQVRASVLDAGGAGVYDVRVYLDTPFSQVLPWKPAYANERTDSFSVYSGAPGDGTPATASGTVPMSRATGDGAYHVLKVVVTDMAGNRTVYGAAELQAMGASTTIEVKGGIQDTTAPVLLDLSLPATYDINQGGGPLRPVVKVQDNAGGTGIDRVLVRFEGESGLGTYTILRPQSTPEVLPQDGQPVSLANPGMYLNWSTTSGVNRIADVTVFDIAGNQTVYTRAQLEAMGMNTTLAVVNGASKTAAFTQALRDGALELDVSSTAWTSAGANSFKLVLTYDPTAAQFDSAVLAGVPGLEAERYADRDFGRITVSGNGIGAAQALAGVHVSFRPVEGKLGHWSIQEFTVNGKTQGFGPGAPGGTYLRGGAGHDVADLRGYTSDGAVSRTADGFKVVTSTGYTTVLADVEEAIVGAGRIALDPGGAAGQLYRLYQAAVDRAPDPTGLGYWIAQVEDGAPLREVARAFMAGAEFHALYGASPSDEAFITALYDNVLHRAPDGAGLAWWRDAFADGLTREEALLSFSESEENLAQVAPAIGNGIEYVLW